MQQIRLGETNPALAVIPFTSVQSANLVNRISGATLPNAQIAIWIRRGGIAAAVAGGAGAFTAVDDTRALGLREYLPAVSEQVVGVSTFIFTGLNMEPRECQVMFVPEDPYRPAYYGALVAGSLTTTVVTTNRTETTPNAWRNALIEFLTGPNTGSVQKISGYTGTGTIGTFTLALALPATPTVGDLFRIIT